MQQRQRTTRDEIRRMRIRVERLRWQKIEALAKAIRHRTYRVRNEDIAESILREVRYEGGNE